MASMTLKRQAKEWGVKSLISLSALCCFFCLFFLFRFCSKSQRLSLISQLSPISWSIIANLAIARTAISQLSLISQLGNPKGISLDRNVSFQKTMKSHLIYIKILSAQNAKFRLFAECPCWRSRVAEVKTVTKFLSRKLSTIDQWRHNREPLTHVAASKDCPAVIAWHFRDDCSQFLVMFCVVAKLELGLDFMDDSGMICWMKFVGASEGCCQMRGS
jgi:hypothetical protein